MREMRGEKEGAGHSLAIRASMKTKDSRRTNNFCAAFGWFCKLVWGFFGGGGLEFGLFFVLVGFRNLGFCSSC